MRLIDADALDLDREVELADKQFGIRMDFKQGMDQVQEDV